MLLFSPLVKAPELRDVKFITDEILDFSQASAFDGQEEEEEGVFGICPTEPSERCAAQSIDMNVLQRENEDRAREVTFPRSPLSPEKLEEVMTEANRLAAQMERCELLEEENGSSETRLEMVPDFEPLPSIESLHVVRKDSKAPRRRTFNVSNSPLKALLPTVGPESCLSVGSPKAPFPEIGSPTSCVADPPVPKRLQNKSNACIPDNQLSKKSRPNRPPTSLAAVKSLDPKKTTTRCIKKEKSSPPTLPRQNRKPLPSLRPPLQTNRKGPWKETEKPSGKACSAEGSQDPPSRGTKPVAYMKARLGPRLDPLKTGPVKKASATPEKVELLQKANASQATSMGSSIPRSQASYKAHSSFREIRTRNSAMSGLASRLPMRNLNTPAFQQTVPSGTFQNSRLRLPKATSGKSRCF